MSTDTRDALRAAIQRAEEVLTSRGLLHLIEDTANTDTPESTTAAPASAGSTWSPTGVAPKSPRPSAPIIATNGGKSIPKSRSRAAIARYSSSSR